VTSEARARPRDEEEAMTSTDMASPDPGGEPTGATDVTDAPTTGAPDAPGTGDADDADVVSSDGSDDRSDDGSDGPRARRRPAVPALLVLLLLLLGAAGFLWFTRPTGSAVRTGDYAAALQAARSGIVDYTSFDYLTLDDDIEQIRRIAVGDLRDEGVAQLDGRRQEIADAKAVVNTEVVGAGVTRANDKDATVLLVIQSTQQSTASDKPQIVRYRIEVTLQRSGERWLLSGIKGTDGGNNG
jgi:hypothetical protein